MLIRGWIDEEQQLDVWTPCKWCPTSERLPLDHLSDVFSCCHLSQLACCMILFFPLARWAWIGSWRNGERSCSDGLMFSCPLGRCIIQDAAFRRVFASGLRTVSGTWCLSTVLYSTVSTGVSEYKFWAVIRQTFLLRNGSFSGEFCNSLSCSEIEKVGVFHWNSISVEFL